ncbi:MAG: haloacid dehalogenase-like hydrolase [Muribaculaceae bacterium]|nr:haloacid dehalogenase-like hydrolase [Muribaculaceae bacterium]
MKVAFFDFDGTLKRHDSFIEFAVFSVGRKATAMAVLQSLPALILWKLGIKTNSEVKQKLFTRLYRGMSYVRFQELGRAYARKIDADLRSEIIELKNKHQDAGHKLIIVSASVGDWIRPWALRNGFDTVLATEAEVDSGGNLTGRFSTPNCHGVEKAARIRHLFPEITDYESWGYGDSSGDYAMIALVKHAQKV